MKMEMFSYHQNTDLYNLTFNLMTTCLRLNHFSMKYSVILYDFSVIEFALNIKLKRLCGQAWQE